MKSTMIRAFVIALALTGAAATAHSKSIDSGLSASALGGGSFPVPMCSPNDPNGCGIR